MASWWDRVTAATQAAVVAWQRTYSDPSSVQGGAFTSQQMNYNLLWAFYTNSAFEDLTRWSGYKSTYSLYRQTRSLYNPVRRLVDFYAGQVYPGVLSIDGSKLPDGVPLAIPLAEDTNPQLRDAIGQLWQWTNWQQGKAVYVRYGAVAGSVLVEVIDDLDRAKVTLNVVWPGLVTDLQLDATGNVKAYTVEYKTEDENNKPYTFKKVVDPDVIRFYRDDKPFAYLGGPSEVANPYGFVPAVWAKHRDLGGDHGAPAIHGSIGKIDEVNSLASHINDQVHKVINAPVMLWGGQGAASVFGNAKRGATDEETVPTGDRESVLMLTGPENGHVETLAGDLPLADALALVQNLIGEIEQDYPELAMYRELRAMSQVTGPAAVRLMGDVGANVWEASANYDQQSIKLFQMAVAIGGWRANRGDWGSSLSRQQVKFRPFNLESYARGDLDFEIMPRPLIAPTELERQQLEQAKVSAQRQTMAMEADRQAMMTPGGADIAQRLMNAAGGGA